MIPLLLPEMHERYFYLAEVLTVLAAFVDRRFIAVAAGIQIASISTYLSYLNDSSPLSLGVAAVVALGAGVPGRDHPRPAPERSTGASPHDASA